MGDSAVAVIGPGRLGLSLAARLGAAGLECGLVRGRRPIPPASRRRLSHVRAWDTWTEPCAGPLPEIVVIAVPDPLIREAALLLADSNPEMTHRVVFHTSGLATSRELEPCRAAGAATGSWHPLQSFPVGAAVDLWSDTACAIEGDPEAVAAGFELAEKLGMRPWSIDPEVKPRYHAAAAVAGNLTFLLVAEARSILESCGLDRSMHPDPLARLVATATSSALEVDPAEGLTGPIARRDRDAIRRHLEALPPHLSIVYDTLARAFLLDDASDWLD